MRGPGDSSGGGDQDGQRGRGDQPEERPAGGLHDGGVHRSVEMPYRGAYRSVIMLQMHLSSQPDLALAGY